MLEIASELLEAVGNNAHLATGLVETHSLYTTFYFQLSFYRYLC
jgi:hypothetical protein